MARELATPKRAPADFTQRGLHGWHCLWNNTNVLHEYFGQTRLTRAHSTGSRTSPAVSGYTSAMKLKIVLEASDEGGFTAYVPSLPGCISEGDSREDALRNIREAIELYLEPVDDDLAGKEGEIAELVV